MWLEGSCLLQIYRANLTFLWLLNRFCHSPKKGANQRHGQEKRYLCCIHHSKLSSQVNVCKIKALSDSNAPSDTPRSSIVNTISGFFFRIQFISFCTRLSLLKHQFLRIWAIPYALFARFFLIKLKMATFPIYTMPLRNIKLDKTEFLIYYPYTLAVKQKKKKVYIQNRRFAAGLLRRDKEWNNKMAKM